MSTRLRLEFLGLPQVALGDTSIATDRRKAIALLAYLAVSDVSRPRQKYPRESLSALLWPDYEQTKAFSNLRRTLWEVNQALGEGWLLAERESLQLDPDAEIEHDVAHFLDLISDGCQQTEAAFRVPLLSEAVKLYRNHFLTGFSLKDAYPFNEWAFATSEQLRQKLAEGLTLLVEGHRALEQPDQAIPYARRLISFDPLNESAHRQLMEVYLQAGQHSAALKQYQTCEQILRKELNLDPQPETRALYRKIRRGEMKAVPVQRPVESRPPQHNLPLQLSSFIGREKEQDEIAVLLLKNRLVTLAGPGGIGKTRLSLQVGQSLLNDYPDGVWFIALDALSDPTLVPQTVASVFNLQEQADRSLLEKLTDFLREKKALLILDNCEHLLEACVQIIAALLQTCEHLKILVTSRETLNLSGEAIYFLRTLSMPERQLRIEKLTKYESIRLFTERASLALSSFSLRNENAGAVVEICRKVDGIPLAIELAAARVNILQVDEILSQLQNSFVLLSSDGRTVLPRQQTLEASMDWSWGLLTDTEQTFLQRLSVFAGGWTLESAQAICDRDGLPASLEQIRALVKKSLIMVEQEPGRETRYRFHEIVRQYLRKKSIGTDEAKKIRTRHLVYFLHLSQQAELELRGPTRVAWMDRLHDERHNLRAALHWAEHTDVEAGLWLSARLMRYWESADLQEGKHWLEAFLHRSESKESPHARAAALLTYGWLLTWLQEFMLAHTVTEESLSLFRAAGDRQGEIDSLISLANIDQFTDGLDSGTKLLQQALGLAQALDDKWRQGFALGFLGWDRRDVGQAFGYWEKAIRLYREVGDQISLANLLSLLAQFRILNGEIEVGEKHLDESILLWKSNKRANAWEHPKLVKSLILALRGEYEQAYTLLQEALASAQATGNRMSQLWLRVRLGYVALRAGNLVEAHDLLKETLLDFHRDEYISGAVFALEGIATLLIATGQPEKAARLIGCADATREKISNMRPVIEEADMYRNMAEILARIGPSAFEVAYDEGRHLSLDDAVAYALEEK